MQLRELCAGDLSAKIYLMVWNWYKDVPSRDLVGYVDMSVIELWKLTQVSFQWKNPDFLLKNVDFLMKNLDFIIQQTEEQSVKLKHAV